MRVLSRKWQTVPNRPLLVAEGDSRAACARPTGLAVAHQEYGVSSCLSWGGCGHVHRQFGGAMPGTSLGAFHGRLHAHFSWLRKRRDDISPGQPVFALEHGLDLEDREALASTVGTAIERGDHPRDEWLPHIVYATELGYAYTGDEYWQTFEAQSPGWKELGDRTYIRRKFRAFADEFGGAVPSGPWAEHFSIIAWPITHAVLPTDLQRHLARLLYELRHEITLELLASPDALGRRLTSRSFYTSARFQKFAENAELLGLVASALLSDEQEEARGLLKGTLDRIVGDLSAQRQAHSWLNDARTSAIAVRARGVIQSDSGTSQPIEGGPRDASRRPSSTDPTLWARRQADGWVLELELPDLSELGIKLPRLQEELSRKRARISGKRQPLARGRLLYPGQRVTLDHRPEAGRSVLEIENGDPMAQELLRDHCLLSPPPWIFRIPHGDEGREVRGNSVRPGQSYLYVNSTAPPFEYPTWVNPQRITTDGLVALLLDLPPKLDDRSVSALTSLGLRVVADLELTPVGVVPANWDGEGVATWMVGDDPVLGLRSSSQPSSLTVTVDAEATSFTWPDGQDCIFLKLDRMDTGTHQVRFHVTFASESVPPFDGDLGVLIRPSPAASHSVRFGLRLVATPAQPYLTELWDGDACVEVVGPRGVSAKITCDFRSRNRGNSLAKCTFQLPLPIGRSDWLQAFRREVQGDKQVSAAYDDADFCIVGVSHDELGVLELRAERPFSPLRWSIRSAASATVARLINNSSVDAPTISHFEREAPNRPMPVATEEDADALHFPSGGLLVAGIGDISASVILPPEVRDLADIQRVSEAPDLRVYATPSKQTVGRIIDDSSRWLEADVPADLMAQRLQHTVVRAFARRLCELIGGQNWSHVERQVANDEFSLRRDLLCEAMGQGHRDKALARDIWSDMEHLRQVDPPERAESLTQKLASVIRVSRGLSLSVDTVEATMMLASEPGRLAASSQERDAVVNLVLERPVVLRAARMVVLCVHAAEELDEGSAYRGWAWQSR